MLSFSYDVVEWRLTRPRWPLSPRSLWSQCGMSARVRVGTLGWTWSLLVSPRGRGGEIASCCLGAWLRQRERSLQGLVSSLACLSQYNWALVVWAYTAGVFGLSTNRCLEIPGVLWPRQKGFNALLAIIKINNWPLVTKRILLNRFMIHCFLCGYGYRRILSNISSVERFYVDVVGPVGPSATDRFLSVLQLPIGGRSRANLSWEKNTVMQIIRLSAVAYSKRYSKVLEYEYRVKTAALGTLKRYSILSLTLYLE
jgi:hypothetical protein